MGVTGRVRGSFIDDPAHDRAVWPRSYWRAIRGRGRDISCCWVFRVDRRLSSTDYHSNYSEGLRRTCLFRVNGENVLVPRGDHTRMPPCGLSEYDEIGGVLAGTTYVRWPTNLVGAPILPEYVSSWLRRKKYGQGHRIARGDRHADQTCRAWASA